MIHQRKISGLSVELEEARKSSFASIAQGLPTVRHADYLGAWLDVLREDNRAIIRAASAASKAADWLLSRHADARSAEDERRPGNNSTGKGRAAA